METTLETENQNADKKVSEILGFRDQLLSREILSCGVNIDHSMLHFGAGYNNSMLFEYLTNIVTNSLVQELNVKYFPVDVNSEKINHIIDLNQTSNIEIHPTTIDMQTYLDENRDEFDWTIITGIFDKNLYGENQFQFIDKIVSETLNISKEGVIFTFDSSVDTTDEYSIENIIQYVQSIYSRYKVSRINEHNYVICINKYFHSINN